MSALFLVSGTQVHDCRFYHAIRPVKLTCERILVERVSSCCGDPLWMWALKVCGVALPSVSAMLSRGSMHDLVRTAIN